MGWVSYFAAALAIINTIWNIWRWRVDRTYVAFALEIKNTDEAADDYVGCPVVEFRNAGTATAHNVHLAFHHDGVDSDIAIALGGESGFIPALRPDDPPRIFELRNRENSRITGWRITYETRPRKKTRVERWNRDLTQRMDQPSTRQRIGGRIAGNG